MSARRETMVIPSARRLMASLRDIGYDTPSAVADLVDNSIDAAARKIDISVAYSGTNSWIRIADDGIGMTGRELDEAMRYGSRRSYQESALGHFGLGLKTASLSQCRRLTVAARSTASARIEIRRWDLDRVTASDAWSLERLTPRQCSPALTEPLAGTSGTVVMWERLDRVLGYARPQGHAAMSGLERVIDEIGEHLSMTFHRFLSGEVGRHRSRIRMTLGGRPLEAWDPFARSEAATQVLRPQSIALEHAGARHRVRIRPYILPNQIRFSSVAAHTRAAGPKRWNRQQGLYIYRHDRLIQSGGWNRLRTLDEHTKLARVALDIPPAAGAAFQTNVSKMTVSLPEGLRSDLRALVSGVVIRAQDVYRQRVELIDGGGDDSVSEEASSTRSERTLGVRLADEWPMITAVLERELGSQPDVLRRVLVALANARSTEPQQPRRLTVRSTTS
jgi:hypothetical protein